ncbi:MAG: hypothetical protein R2883_08050 [Caldisericia bacterium]
MTENKGKLVRAEGPVIDFEFLPGSFHHYTAQLKLMIKDFDKKLVS